MTEDGVILEDCSPAYPDEVVTYQEVAEEAGEDVFYCVHAESVLEAWIIGQRLLGHEPTDAEIEQKKLAFADIPPPPEEADNQQL